MNSEKESFAQSKHKFRFEFDECNSIEIATRKKRQSPRRNSIASAYKRKNTQQIIINSEKQKRNYDEGEKQSSRNDQKTQVEFNTSTN